MVFIKNYAEPEYNKKEIFRYLGMTGEDPAIKELVDECISELGSLPDMRVCYLNLHVENEMVQKWIAESSTVKKCLSDCENIVLFAATVGILPDRLIAKYSSISAAKAVVFQAIGAERIEALCDAFCDDIKREFSKTGQKVFPRFSPGYGDFDIGCQKEIFALLDCSRKIGLSLNESMLMSPTKSVTAIVVIGGKK